MNTRTIATVAVAAALGLTACAAPVEATKVTPGASASVEAIPQTTSEETASVEAPAEDAVEEEPEVTIPTSFKVGETAKIGDWEVTVTKVTKPTTNQVRKWNSFNDKPKGQYVVATYTAKYVGTERTADSMFDLSWKFGGSDGQVYDTAFLVTGADKDDAPTEARPGGKIKQDAAFDVPAKAVKGGVVSVEGYDASFDRTYADFKF